MAKYTRARDMEVEREIGLFLDKYLYSSGAFTRAERTNDILRQMQGSDIIISIPSLGIKDAIVDEKALSHYINDHIPTCILELSFIANNQVVDGWFVDENKETEYYALQWITAKKDYWNIKESDIVYIEYILVRKKKLLEYFASLGLSCKALKQKAALIRQNDIEGQIDRTANKDYYFFYTKNLQEKPINLVVDKSLYQRLATYSFIVTKDGLYQKPNRI